MIPYFLQLEKESYEDETLVCFVQCRLCRHCHCTGRCLAGRRKTGRGCLLAGSLSTPWLLPSLYLELFPREGGGRRGPACWCWAPLSVPNIHTVREQKQTPQGWALPLLPFVQQPGKQCGKRIPSWSSSHKGTHRVRVARPGDSFLKKRGWGGTDSKQTSKRTRPS